MVFVVTFTIVAPLNGSSVVVISEDPKSVVVVLTKLFVDLVVVNCVVVLVNVVTVLRVTGNSPALYSPFLVHMVSTAILGLSKSGLLDKSQVPSTLLS